MPMLGLGCLTIMLGATAPRAAVVLREPFSGPDGLVTNQYAHWNPIDPKARRSRTWDLTSGSLFVRGGKGWTGIPDDRAPDVESRTGTGSSVFRMTTRRGDFDDVEVSFSVRNAGLRATRSTPPVDWDGLHVWLRYQSQFHLYSASVNRRDGTAVIKKKTPGGPSNGGTYVALSGFVPYKVPYGTWQKVRATIKDRPDGSVEIALFIDGRLLVSARDAGRGGPPIRRPGKIGLRGDNAELYLAHLTVRPLPASGGRKP